MADLKKQVVVSVYRPDGSSDLICMDEGEAHDKYSEQYHTMQEILPIPLQGEAGQRRADKFLDDIGKGCQLAGPMVCHGVFIGSQSQGMIPYGTELFLGVVCGCAASNNIHISQ